MFEQDLTVEQLDILSRFSIAYNGRDLSRLCHWWLSTLSPHTCRHETDMYIEGSIERNFYGLPAFEAQLNAHGPHLETTLGVVPYWFFKQIRSQSSHQMAWAALGNYTDPFHFEKASTMYASDDEGLRRAHDTAVGLLNASPNPTAWWYVFTEHTEVWLRMQFHWIGELSSSRVDYVREVKRCLTEYKPLLMRLFSSHYKADRTLQFTLRCPVIDQRNRYFPMLLWHVFLGCNALNVKRHDVSELMLTALDIETVGQGIQRTLDLITPLYGEELSHEARHDYWPLDTEHIDFSIELP